MMWKKTLSTVALASACLIGASLPAAARMIHSAGEFDNSWLGQNDDPVTDEDRLEVRNTLAVLGLLYAYAAQDEGPHSMVLVTTEPAFIPVTFSADGKVAHLGPTPLEASQEIALIDALEDIHDELPYETTVDVDDGVVYTGIKPIEDILGTELFGLVDVVMEGLSFDLYSQMDPFVEGLAFWGVYEAAMGLAFHSDCVPGGYVGEMCDTLGIKTGCACLDQDDPATGESTLDGLTDPDQPDGCQAAWDFWEWLDGLFEPDEEEDEEGTGGEDDEDPDEETANEPDSIAPWSEGPMFIADEPHVVHAIGSLPGLMW